MILYKLRVAISSDIKSIVDVVNHAYRPLSRNVSWTDESALIDGKRTTDTQVRELLNRPHSVVLLAQIKTEIVACIHLEKCNDASHIGMFAVLPNQQGKGLGKMLLAHAEDYAIKEFASKKFMMEVVALRIELIDFYLRRGYQKTGRIFDYPLFAGVGKPKKANLKVECLEKYFRQM